MTTQNQYSDEEILAMLRACAEEYEVCSPRAFRQMDDVCSPSLVMRRFGSWTDAKKRAGISDEPDVGGRKQQYTDEQVLADIRECAQKNDGKCTVELMQADKDLVSPSVAVERFKSWLDAKKKAGIEDDERSTNSRPRDYTDEDYLELLRECEEKHGKVTQKVFNKEAKKREDHPTAGAVRKRFGTEEQAGWSRAKELAGIESSDRNYTNEELLEMLRTCKEKHGKATSSVFAYDEEFCAPETLQRRFGSWQKAKDKAGV